MTLGRLFQKGGKVSIKFELIFTLGKRPFSSLKAPIHFANI